MQAARTCPRCQKPLLRPDQKFCPFCGQRLAPEEAAASSSVSGAPATAAPLQPVTQPLGERWLVPPPTRSPRELIFELALAFAAQGRAAEAVETLDRAARESGPNPSAADLHFQKGRISEAAGNRSIALREYLEGVWHAPSELPRVLDHLHRWLTLDLVTTHGAWITRDWIDALRKMGLGPEGHARLGVFAAHVHLLLGNLPKVLKELSQALSAAPEETRKLAEQFLLKGELSPALSSTNDGSARFALARIHQALGNRELALQQVEEALQIGMEGPNEPDAPLHELKARLLEGLGDTAAAAQSYYEAGHRYNWRSELPRARKLLRRAIHLRPKHAPSHWFLAETLRLMDRPKTVRDAAEVWDRAAQELGPPKEACTWAYTVRALTNDQLVQLTSPPPQETWRLYGHGILWLECGLLLEAPTAVLWTYLGQFFSYWNLTWNALASTTKALELDPDYGQALDVHAMNQIYAGQPKQAEKTIDRWIQLHPTDPVPYAKLWSVILQQRYKQALELLASLINQFPSRVDLRELRALCLERTGQQEAAAADWEEILKLSAHQESPPFGAAYAAYRLNRCQEAISLFQQLRQVPMEIPGRPTRYLGLVHLAGGDWPTGAELLSLGIAEADSAWELKHFLEFDFLPLTQARRTAGKRRDTLTRLKRLLRNRIQELRRIPPDPVLELSTALRHLTEQDKLHSLDAVVFRAALARHHAAASEWREAASLYAELMPSAADFPEVGRGLQNALEQLAKEGAALLQAGRAQEALEQCTIPGQGLVERFPGLAVRAAPELAAQFAVAQFLQNEPQRAREAFAATLDLLASFKWEEPGRWLGEYAAALLPDTARYWALHDLLQDWLGSLPATHTLRMQIAAVRVALEVFLSTKLGLRADAESRAEYWFVSPIGVELEPGLIPEDTENWTLIVEDTPRIRDELLRSTGVEVPQVRFRRNDTGFTRGTYLFTLHGVPLVTGTIQPDLRSSSAPSSEPLPNASIAPEPVPRPGWMRFSPAPPETLRAAGIAEENLVPGMHPVTGLPGCWVAQPSWKQTEEQAIELWRDPLEYLVQHLKGFLRVNLSEFLDMEGVSRWMSRAVTADPDLAQDAAPNIAARLALGRLLRGLTQDGVPVTDTTAILQVFSETQLGRDQFVTLRSVRARLKSQLPGNAPGTQRLLLPESLEAAIASGVTGSDDRTCLALEATPTQQVLADLRKLLATQPACALVVQQNDLRPFVRRLTQLEWPQLRVISQDELFEPTEVSHA